MNLINQKNLILVAIREILHDDKQIRIVRQRIRREIKGGGIRRRNLLEQYGFPRSSRTYNAHEMPTFGSDHLSIQITLEDAPFPLAHRQVMKLQDLGVQAHLVD